MDILKPSILYVEDESGIRENLAEFLERFTKDLYLAEDGKVGLELFEKYKPDIVISDIKMPNMDGIEMAKRIKEINEEQYIIFTTAFSDNDFFIQAIDLQVYSYILKPVKLKHLEKKINEIVNNINTKDDLEKKEQMLIQQSKMAAMGEMISNIAHQWRQPLGTISVIASGLQLANEKENISKDKIDEDMELIIENTKYLSQTIDDFKNFFSNLNQEGNKASLSDFLEKSVSLTSAAFINNDIVIIKDIADDIKVVGDKNQLIQAIINILNNAKDALKEKNQNKKCVFIVTAKQNEHGIIISIKDNAGGIGENIIDKVFEPYFTTKSKDNGTGLGLYISKEIITKNLNGTIEVKNEEFQYEKENYKGANFIITLPLYKE